MTTQKNLWDKKMSRKLGALQRLEKQILELEPNNGRNKSVSTKLGLKKKELENLKKNLRKLGWQGE